MATDPREFPFPSQRPAWVVDLNRKPRPERPSALDRPVNPPPPAPPAIPVTSAPPQSYEALITTYIQRRVLLIDGIDRETATWLLGEIIPAAEQLHAYHVKQHDSSEVQTYWHDAAQHWRSALAILGG